MPAKLRKVEDAPKARLTREARRHAILDAAREVFGRKGFEATRMDDVAAAAGIAKGLLYKHFESKDELFGALVDRQGRELVAELRGALTLAADPLDGLAKGLTIWLRQVSGDAGTFQMSDPGIHSAYDDLRHGMRDVIAEALLAAAPSAEPRLAALAAAAIEGAAEAVGLEWARRDDVTEEEALLLLTQFCWGGLSLLQSQLAD